MVLQEQQLELGGGVLACWVGHCGVGGRLLLRRQRARASTYAFTHMYLGTHLRQLTYFGQHRDKQAGRQNGHGENLTSSMARPNTQGLFDTFFGYLARWN